MGALAMRAACKSPRPGEDAGFQREKHMLGNALANNLEPVSESPPIKIHFRALQDCTSQTPPSARPLRR